MWVWNHFTFMRPIPPSIPEAGIPFPHGLHWGLAVHAPEVVTGHCYVGRLFFEMLVPAQVICPLLIYYSSFGFTDSLHAFQVTWRPYAEGEHEDVPEIARDRIVFDRDIWLHCWNHCHFQQISGALRQLGRRQIQPQAHPFRVWCEIQGEGDVLATGSTPTDHSCWIGFKAAPPLLLMRLLRTSWLGPGGWMTSLASSWSSIAPIFWGG